MTVNTKKITSGPYTGNGIADTFSYTFKVEDKTELSVYETDDTGVQVLLTVDTDYTVDVVGVDGGGTITRTAGALPVGYSWYIRSNFEETQLTSFESQGAFFPDLHEKAIDKLTLLIQQLVDEKNRSPTVPASYAGQLPLSLEEPLIGAALRWNSTGTGIENYDQTVFNTVDLSTSEVLLSSDNVTEMKSKSKALLGVFIATKGYVEKFDGGSALYVVVAGGTGPNDGGTHINLDNGLQARLLYDGNVHIKQLGITEGVDGTEQWNAVYPNLSDGTTVNVGNGSFIGSFVWNSRLNFKGEGAVFTNVLPDKKIVACDAYEKNAPDEHIVSETTLNNGDTQFTVTGASGLFQKGDIGYLWDGAIFPGGSARVNTESVKIKSISGDVITIEGFICAHKGVSTIRFIHSTNQIKNVEISGIIINPTADHNQLCCSAQGVDILKIYDVEANEFTGSCVRTDFCYNVTKRDIRPLNPVNTGSGQGYGVENRGCKVYIVDNIQGNGCRHVYDADSTYVWKVTNVVDMEDKSAPVNISHTGFCGYGIVDGVTVKTAQYPITGNGTGYGGGPSDASKANHPMRNVSVFNVDSTVNESKTPNTSNVTGVYIRSLVENVTIDGVTVRHANFAIPTAVNNNNIVRIDGVAIGQLTIKNIKADAAGRMFFSTGDSDGVVASNELTVIEDVNVTYCWEPIFVQGSWRVSTDDLGFKTIGGGTLFKAQNLSGQPTLGVYIGDNIHYEGADIQLYSHLENQQTTGRFEGLPRSMSVSISIVNGDSLTYAEIQNRKGSISLVPPSASAISMSVNALPQPLIDGQRLSIYNTLNASDGDRGNITFPAGGTVLNQFVVVDDGKPVHVISRNGKWVEN